MMTQGVLAAEPKRGSVAGGRRARITGLIALGALLVVVMGASIAVGAHAIPLSTVIDALMNFDGSTDQASVRDLRVPRTLLGLVAGVALGVAGTLMQALTRNPLADPGILGINAGSAAAVVAAISFLGVSEFHSYVWFAFAGAGITAVVVYALGAAQPVRLAVAGTAVAFALVAFTQAITMLDATAFNEFRFWVVGSLAGRKIDVLIQLLPFVGVGTILAFASAGALNAIALGEETGRSLGVNLRRLQIVIAVAVILLCGAATAAVGPIVFVGLAIPHIARTIVGADHRWQLPFAMLLGPILLLIADIIGRVVVSPSELQVGIVTAVLGGPLFMVMVARKRITHL